MSILICGVSGAGKTTVVKSLGKQYKTQFELGENELVDFWYKEHVKFTESDHYAKNMFIMNKLAVKYLYAINNDISNTIYDRFIFDDRVAMELRVKDRHPEIYLWMVKKFNEYAADLKSKNKLPKLAIILTISDFDIAKKRIIERGRDDEARKINEDDTWYKHYFSIYPQVIKKALDQFGVKWIELDVTNFEKNDTYNAVNLLIKNSI